MKYRKKPIVIEAFKWTADVNQQEDPEWIVEAIKNEIVWFIDEGTSDIRMIIKTLEGNHEATRGDYIIKGIKGEIYPCKPDIFSMTYELAEKMDERKFLIIHNVCGERNEDVVLCHLKFEDFIREINKAYGEDELVIFKSEEGMEIAINPKNIFSAAEILDN